MRNWILYSNWATVIFSIALEEVTWHIISSRSMWSFGKKKMNNTVLWIVLYIRFSFGLKYIPFWSLPIASYFHDLYLENHHFFLFLHHIPEDLPPQFVNVNDKRGPPVHANGRKMPRSLELSFRMAHQDMMLNLTWNKHVTDAATIIVGTSKNHMQKYRKNKKQKVLDK